MRGGPLDFHAVLPRTLTGGQQGQTTLRLQYIQAGLTEYISPAVTITVT